MKLGSSYWILLSFLFLIFSGTAGAHPHELGKLDHGPSLDSYQVDLDFTINHSTKGWHAPDIILAKKDQSENGSKSDKSVRNKKSDKTKNRQIQKTKRPIKINDHIF